MRIPLAPLAAGLALLLAALPTTASAVLNLTVNTTADTHATNLTTGVDSTGKISLRSAIEAANATASSGTAQAAANVISVPNGTYTLTLGELPIGTGATGSTTTINFNTFIIGASQAGTIIQHSTATADATVFDINYNSATNLSCNLSNLTIAHGRNLPGIGGGGIVCGGPGEKLTCTNVTFDDNQVTGTATNTPGGAVGSSTGGSLLFTNCIFTNNRGAQSAGGAIYHSTETANDGLTITGCTFTGNVSNGGQGGGAVHLTANGVGSSTHTITNSVFTGNQTPNINTIAEGGGAVRIGGVNGVGVLNISGCSFVNNSVGSVSNTGHGGAIHNDGGTTTVHFCRFVGNAVGTARSAISYYIPGGGTLNADSNWFASNSGPVNGFDVIDASGTNTTTNHAVASYLKLTASASPTSVNAGATATITAGFTKDSLNATIAPSNLTAFVGLPITFSNAVRGTLSGAQTAIQASGSATVTFTAGASAGAGSANAIMDGTTATATLTVIGAPTANAQSVSVAHDTAKTITLSGSDPNSPPLALTYAITANPAHGALSGTSPNFTYTPATGYHGADSIQFTATNSAGVTSAAATVSLTVATGTPVANAQSVSTTANTAKAITLTASDNDTPALSLTYAVSTNPAHGTLSGTPPNLTYTPAANYVGSDSFGFTANNGTNTSAAATVSITVTGTAPTITSASGVTFVAGSSGSFTVTATGLPAPTLSETGALPNGVTFTNNGNGTATLAGIPALSSNASYTFTIAASNGVAPNASQSFTLTVNRPPVAGADTMEATQNQASQRSVARLLSNDSDADSDPLSVISVSANSAQGGTVSLSAPGNSGTVTYTPPTGFKGTDTFTYVVSDGRAGQATGTVTVTVRDPNAPGLKVVSITRTTNGTELVQFVGVPTERYIVQSTDDLTVAFAPRTAALTPAVDGSFQFEDMTALPARRFYRAVATP